MFDEKAQRTEELIIVPHLCETLRNTLWFSVVKFSLVSVN